MTDGEDESDRLMQRALALARQALELGEVPVGCLFVRHGQVVAEGRNSVNETRNATRHAEMNCVDIVITLCADLHEDPRTFFAQTEVVMEYTEDDCDMFMEHVDSCKGNKTLTEAVMDCHPGKKEKMSLECGCIWLCTMEKYEWVNKEGTTLFENNVAFYKTCTPDHTPDKAALYLKTLIDCDEKSKYGHDCERAGDILQCVLREGGVAMSL